MKSQVCLKIAVLFMALITVACVTIAMIQGRPLNLKTNLEIVNSSDDTFRIIQEATDYPVVKFKWPFITRDNPSYKIICNVHASATARPRRLLLYNSRSSRFLPSQFVICVNRDSSRIILVSTVDNLELLSWAIDGRVNQLDDNIDTHRLHGDSYPKRQRFGDILPPQFQRDSGVIPAHFTSKVLALIERGDSIELTVEVVTSCTEVGANVRYLLLLESSRDVKQWKFLRVLSASVLDTEPLFIRDDQNVHDYINRILVEYGERQ